ncbi:OsmC-like protein [Dongia mobilis]|uniref:OsmC-like protein n=1 Tax=Dongia mobilis TaxID=578943 RepID=A0A4R6WK98_9PROT|nr:OsmC family protein [Dongia mobilis]TDQ80973.1 OsmC-like protein [Dongia mobilis]
MSRDTKTSTSQPSARITLTARTNLAGHENRPDMEPVRRVLAALADSLAATYRGEALSAGIPLEQVDIRVEAGLDFDRLDPAHLRIEVRLQSPAGIAALEALRLAVEDRDPLIRLVRQAIPTRLEIALDLRETRSIAA